VPTLTSSPVPQLAHTGTRGALLAGDHRSVGVQVDVLAVSQRLGRAEVLHNISLSVEPGELVGIAGGSGAGKTTLLEAMAGLRQPTSGAISHDGRAPALDGRCLGFVPQDDIIHRGLPLRRTLQYAAKLRLPAGTPRHTIDRAVDQALDELQLADHGDVLVGALSGGQRKRASVAVELLTRPRLLFLDEPTSGLDPVTSAEVLSILRRLAGGGVTVVLTTHDPANIDACDRVIFLTPGGHLAFAGTPGAARDYFGVTSLAHAYQLLAHERFPQDWAARFAAEAVALPLAAPRIPVTPPGPRTAGPTRQCVLLAQRTVDILIRSRLTLAVLLGSPVLVISMMAVLFPAGGFERPSPGALGPVQTVFWVAFAGFFFGLTYGLLQVVGEFSVLRRERLAGLRIGSYVASKLAVLAPLLAAVNVAMLVVLRALDRLPGAGVGTYLLLLVVLVVESFCALSLGLLTSATVADAAQATLALPMLCFPQVLFAGAVVPVPDMAAPGQTISVAMANRWAFEALGRGLHIIALDGTAPALAQYADAFSGSALTGCAVLASLGLVFAAATIGVLRSRTGQW
jgi:ABC-type multidrug transport system ATPase subunit